MAKLDVKYTAPLPPGFQSGTVEIKSKPVYIDGAGRVNQPYHIATLHSDGTLTDVQTGAPLSIVGMAQGDPATAGRVEVVVNQVVDGLPQALRSTFDVAPVDTGGGVLDLHKPDINKPVIGPLPATLQALADQTAAVVQQVQAQADAAAGAQDLVLAAVDVAGVTLSLVPQAIAEVKAQGNSAAALAAAAVGMIAWTGGDHTTLPNQAGIYRIINGPEAGQAWQKLTNNGSPVRRQDLEVMSTTAGVSGVPDIATLRSLIGIQHKQRITLLGHTDLSDGGQGEWYWDANSTETDNNGTIVTPVGGTPGRWKRVYTSGPRVFAAWFNHALAAALLAVVTGQTLVLERRTYTLPVMTLTHTNVDIKGNGATIQPTGTLPTDGTWLTLRQVGCDWHRVTFDAMNGIAYRPFSLVSGSKDLYFRRCEWMNVTQPAGALFIGSAVMIRDGVSNVTFEKFKIHDLTASANGTQGDNAGCIRGIELIPLDSLGAAPQNILIEGGEIYNLFSREDGDGICAQGWTTRADIVIRKNKFSTLGKRAVKAIVQGITITENRIENNQPSTTRGVDDMYSAISIYASNCTATGNQVYGTGTSGFGIEVGTDTGTLENVKVDGNTITMGAAAIANQSEGIYWKATVGFTCQGNIIKNALYTIRVAGNCRGGVISGNIVKGAGAPGIWIGDRYSNESGYAVNEDISITANVVLDQTISTTAIRLAKGKRLLAVSNSGNQAFGAVQLDRGTDGQVISNYGPIDAKISYSLVYPYTGLYQRGDEVVNMSVSSNGGIRSWSCTAAGKAHGSITSGASSGTATNGSPTLTSVTGISSWAVGDIIKGTPVPAGATVTAVAVTDSANDIGTLTISANATTTGILYTLYDANFTPNLTSQIDYTIAGKTTKTPSAAQTLTAASVISTAASVVRLTAGTGVTGVTLTSTPTIAAGADGQEVDLVNMGGNALVITLQDKGTLTGSNLRLGATTRALGQGDTLRLRYSTALGYWIETGFTDVL